MPRRSKVHALPTDVKAWLDQALAEGNFSGYEALEAELARLGYTIGKSSLHRYGQKLESRLAAVKASTEAARAIAAAAPDDADLRSAAVMSLVQTDTFNVLVALQEAETAEPAERLKLLARAAEAIATLSRASVNQKRHQAKVQAAALRDAADKAVAVATQAGLSDESAELIRRKILGVA